MMMMMMMMNNAKQWQLLLSCSVYFVTPPGTLSPYTCRVQSTDRVRYVTGRLKPDGRAASRNKKIMICCNMTASASASAQCERHRRTSFGNSMVKTVPSLYDGRPGTTRRHIGTVRTDKRLCSLCCGLERGVRVFHKSRKSQRELLHSTSKVLRWMMRLRASPNSTTVISARYRGRSAEDDRSGLQPAA